MAGFATFARVDLVHLKHKEEVSRVILADPKKNSQQVDAIAIAVSTQNLYKNDEGDEVKGAGGNKKTA